MKELVSFPLFAWVIAYPYHPLVTCSCLLCVCCVHYAGELFVFLSFGPSFISIFIITTYTFSTLPSSPHLPIHYKAYYFVTFFFFFVVVLPSNGRRRLGKFWEWKDWVFLEHWEELEHACNCNFLRAPLLKLCIKWHYFLGHVPHPNVPLSFTMLGLSVLFPHPSLPIKFFILFDSRSIGQCPSWGVTILIV